MIHRIYSSLPSFKSLEFQPGLNVLLAQKEPGATSKQTRNRAGKTSLIEIIHFLCGANADKKSLFRSATLASVFFGMEFDLAQDTVRVERDGANASRVRVDGVEFSHSEWVDRLGQEMFGLQDPGQNDERAPTFRSIFSYFVRRESSHAFLVPEKQAEKQQASDSQMALLFLLGLDWRIASDWQTVRDREKTIAELKKAAGTKDFGGIIGKAPELRTQLTLAEAKLNRYQELLHAFRILPQYRELEAEADQLTKGLNELANDSVVGEAAIRYLELALQSEAELEPLNVRRLYEEAGIALPGVVLQRYRDLQAFHGSVVRNRRDYLAGDLEKARQRLDSNQAESKRLDQRRAEIMGVLQTHGALDQFAKLQMEAGRMGAAVESLRQRFAAAEKLETAKNELEVERGSLMLRLRRNFDEQSDLLNQAILAYEETSGELLDSAGHMTVTPTPNGPTVNFEIQGSTSKGIGNMQIFCFDMMLMRLCASRGIGPRFLVHDSHLFDGVDGRQVGSALKIGAETSEKMGFQYIVTMNEDDAYKETTEGFDLNRYLLPVRLTDATEDGGLFGFRIPPG